MTRDLEPPAVALAVAAHPDDVEFGCGATLAKWTAAGTQIVHVILTDGSKGTWDPQVDPVALAARRQDEQRAASQALGGTGEVVFGEAVDGELEVTLDLRRVVAQAIRRYRPTVVFGHDPWKRYRLHPDHRAAGWLTLDGIVAARDPHFFPDLDESPHRPDTLLLFEAEVPNHVETATEGTLGQRCAALECHQSQFETTHFHRLEPGGDELIAFRARERSKLSAMGQPWGADLGESFARCDDL